MNSHERDLLVKGIEGIFILGLLITAFFAKDWTAAATFALAIATFEMVRDSSKNIEVSKNSVIKEDLTREMELLIKPLYNNRDRFERYESEQAFSLNDSFWKEIENNKYMATKDLREAIENYLKKNKELRKNLSTIENEIRQRYQKEKSELPDTFLISLHNFAGVSRSMGIIIVPPELRKLMEPINEESTLRLLIENYISIIENNDLENIRLDLRNRVIKRYEKLEEKIDAIRESLDET